MEKAVQFDFVHDTQRIFRQLLQSFSHPARRYFIAGEIEGVSGQWPALEAVGITLLDNEVSFYVEKTPKLQARLLDLTLAKPEPPERAQYLFLTSEINYVNFSNMMQTARRGTLADPHMSALFIAHAGALRGEAEMTVTGPGIEGRLSIKTTEYIKTVLQLRQTKRMEYPMGVDLLFVTPQGEIMAFPRLCRVEE